MADFRKQFPDFPAADMPAIPAGFEDCSFDNDMCPSIVSDLFGLHVWIDYADVEKREHAGMRFIVTNQKAGVEIGTWSLETNNWNDVLAIIDARRQGELTIDLANMEVAGLNDFYEAIVGYRPQVDDPTMSDADLRALCISYLEEHNEQARES